MADVQLNDLFRVAPTTAGFMMGGQIANENKAKELQRQESLQDILTKQQAYGQADKMNPLLVQKQGLVNQGLGLDNDKVGLSNDLTRRTQDSTVNSTNATNDATTLGKHLEHAQKTEEFFNRAADQMVNMPPPMRSQWLAQQIQQVGMDPNNPQVQSYVQQASQNPQLLKQHAAQIAQERTARMPEYIKAMAEEKSKRDSAREVEQMRAAAQVKSSQIVAASRVSAASIRSSKPLMDIHTLILNGKIPIERQPAAWREAAAKATSPEEKTYAEQQAADAAALAEALKNPKPTTTVEDGKINSTPPARPYANGAKQYPNAPAVGASMDGHRYKGGDPSDKNNWEKE